MEIAPSAIPPAMPYDPLPDLAGMSLAEIAEAVAGRHWLVTPECRQSIEVEDAAFHAVELRAEGDALAFRLNTDELVVAGPDHPLRAAGDPEVPAIYLAVRRGCEARLNRSTYLQLVEHALAQGPELTVASQGATFALRPA